MNLDTCNYDKMTDTEACFNINGRIKSCGKALTAISVCEVLSSKNGIELKKITVAAKIHYELYMDGDLLNKFKNLKTAQAMFKDFAC